MRLFALICAALFSSHALAQTADPNTLPEMVFWADADRIYANGRITQDTVFKFMDFTKRPNLPGTIRLRSGGGVSVAAMRLAEEVRSLGLDTEADAIPSGPNSKTLQDGNCFSACVDVFLAGTNRTVGHSGRIGVHRAEYPGNQRATYEVEQMKLARLLRYYRQRGVSTEVLELAFETPHNKVRILTWDEMVRWGVVTPPSPVSLVNTRRQDEQPSRR